MRDITPEDMVAPIRERARQLRIPVSRLSMNAGLDESTARHVFKSNCPSTGTLFALAEAVGFSPGEYARAVTDRCRDE